jgi:hypothetical protein
MVSMPAPPSMLSLPSPPTSLSLPPRPLRVSSPLPPSRVSAAAVAVMLLPTSLPVKFTAVVPVKM